MGALLETPSHTCSDNSQTGSGTQPSKPSNDNAKKLLETLDSELRPWDELRKKIEKDKTYTPMYISKLLSRTEEKLKFYDQGCFQQEVRHAVLYGFVLFQLTHIISEHTSLYMP